MKFSMKIFFLQGKQVASVGLVVEITKTAESAVVNTRIRAVLNHEIAD